MDALIRRFFLMERFMHRLSDDRYPSFEHGSFLLVGVSVVMFVVFMVGGLCGWDSAALENGVSVGLASLLGSGVAMMLIGCGCGGLALVYLCMLLLRGRLSDQMAGVLCLVVALNVAVFCLVHVSVVSFLLTVVLSVAFVSVGSYVSGLEQRFDDLERRVAIISASSPMLGSRVFVGGGGSNVIPFGRSRR